MWTDPGNIEIVHRHMNVEIRAEAAPFPEKECMPDYILFLNTELHASQCFVFKYRMNA